MIREIAALHVRALPHTLSSRIGVTFVGWLYRTVQLIGYLKTEQIEGKIVGVISGIGPLILTLAVEPDCQRQGIGKKLVNSLPGTRYVYTEDCSRGFYEKVGFKQMLKIGNLIILCRK